MATQYARAALSAAAAGPAPILVASVNPAAGTSIHQAGSGTTLSSTQFDEVYLWVSNLDTQDHQLTLVFAGGNLCQSWDIPANSPPIPILTGQSFQSGTLSAAADMANKLMIFGHVNTIR